MNLLEIIYSSWFIVILALILDLIIGDPEYKYHPIRLIGNLIWKSEILFRKLSNNQKINGLVFWIFIIGITGSIGYLLCLIHPVFALFITYSCLSIKDLKDKSIIVKEALESEDFKKARNELSMIVGRETDRLDEKEISRAVIETIAENIVDGILAPVFFYLIGGAPLMIIYKAVNTLDSMVGYKNEKYLNFGFASAKMDDLFNFIPARFSYLVIPASRLFTKNNVIRGFIIGLRDGQKNPSPNSGISEAIVAGLLGIQLGGTNYYHGEKINKPTIGDKLFEIDKYHITATINIAYSSGIFFIVNVSAILYLV